MVRNTKFCPRYMFSVKLQKFQLNFQFESFSPPNKPLTHTGGYRFCQGTGFLTPTHTPAQAVTFTCGFLQPVTIPTPQCLTVFRIGLVFLGRKTINMYTSCLAQLHRVSVLLWNPHGVHPKIISMKFLYIKYVDSMDSTLVHMESIWSPCGVHVESTHRFGRALCKKNYMWSPSGLHDSTWTPLDSSWNRWGSVKSSLCLRFLELD